MTTFLGRAAGSLRLTATIFALFGLLFITTGCGALSAMANPKVAWAIGDPAPMSVVVRRADAAETTARQVDRILTATPASPGADWLQTVGPKPQDAAGEVKAIKSEPMYAKSHARVVPAEVWARTLADIQSTGGSSPNLLALISSDLAEAFATISAKEADIADAKRQIETEKAAKDAKGVSDEDKKAHEKTIDDLEKTVSKLEDEVDPLRKKFLAAANDDACIADGAAAVRYPLALRSLPDSVMEVVPVILADIVEEQTGTRPSMNGLKPDVKLDGMDVKLTINGLSQDDLGKLSLGDLTTEAVSRTKKWVVHAITLFAAVSSTKDQLSFEQDTLEALLDGFTASGWKRTTAATIPDGDDPKVVSATAAKPHARKAASAPQVGVAEAQPTKAAAPAPTTPSQTDKTTTDKPVADAPPAAPDPSATVAVPAPSQLAAGMPAACAQYAKAACGDPSLPPEVDRKQFCAGVYKRVNGLAKDADPGTTCRALLKNVTPQRPAR
jgi:hypothetical protein